MEEENIIPVIDIERFSGEEEHEKLKAACEKWGCFRVVNHPISWNLMAEMKAVVRSLLDLPMEVKKRNTDVIAGSGYRAPSAANPLYEALGLYDMRSSQAVLHFCSQLEASAHHREILEKYGKAVHEVLMDIAEKMAKSLGVVDGDQFKDWPCQFRINKYNFTPECVGSSGVQIHTDSGFLTILQEDENVGGLEVMDTCGSFVPVNPMPGSLFAILGDVAHVWSNGRFRYLKHRVECKEATIRVSVASFLLGPKEGYVEAPAELVNSLQPRLFQPFGYEYYKKLRLDKNMRAGEALQLLRLPS